ncbi:hypothetical protein [Brevundimonas sp.]|uniref:hypothetical protein n=1 Tax=Brevundimonas sp. TaxID=1871086 RepID=UPI00121174D4|nr:hypothetical protein [Brevundimonas sp.]TAJ58609.1 MAG: hypothetical protein EPO49_10865 [Brevundimonas sp.]
MRYLAPAAAFLLIIFGAEPAVACRIGSHSLFDTEPRAPLGARAFRGRLVTDGPELAQAKAGEPVPYAEEYFTVVLFALLERPDGPIVRVYSSSLHANSVNGDFRGACDRSNYGAVQDVWIVGRPLSEQDADRIVMLARLGSSAQWIDR